MIWILLAYVPAIAVTGWLAYTQYRDFVKGDL